MFVSLFVTASLTAAAAPKVDCKAEARIVAEGISKAARRSSAGESILGFELESQQSADSRSSVESTYSFALNNSLDSYRLKFLGTVYEGQVSCMLLGVELTQSGG